MPFEKPSPTEIEGGRGCRTLLLAALLVALSLPLSYLACRLCQSHTDAAQSVIQSMVESESIVAFLGLDNAG